jgi:hypothetical protein
MRLWALVLCLGLGGANLGCGPSSFEDFRSQAVQASCDQQVRCGRIGATEKVTRCRLPTEVFAVIQPFAFSDLPGAIKLGRMKFNSGGAQSCLDALRSAPCEPVAAQIKLERYCHNVVQPAAGIDSPCDGPHECEGGTCVQASSGCEGRCVAHPFPGSVCVPLGGPPAQTCDPTTQFCAQDAFDGGLGPFTCHLKRQFGQGCNSGDECAFGFVCDEKSRCNDPPRLGRGAPCTAVGTLCEDGVYCAPTGICTGQKGNAEPCDNAIACHNGLQCLSLQSAAGQVTRAGTCHGFVDVGGSCDPAADPGSTGCPASQLCSATGTCVADGAPARAGYHQPCSTTQPCEFGLACDAGKCEFLLGHNGACTTSALCAPGLTCNGQVCRSQAVCR